MPPKGETVPIGVGEAKTNDISERRLSGYIDMVIAADVFKALAKARSLYKSCLLPAPSISVVRSRCVKCLQDTILVKLPTGTYCGMCGTAGCPELVEPATGNQGP
jgi:hypothetical protein